MIGWKLCTGRSFGDCDDWQTSACFPVLSQSALNRLHLALLHSRGLRDGKPEEACPVSAPVQMCATQTRIRLAPILLTSRHITSRRSHLAIAAVLLSSRFTFKEDSLRHRRVNALQPNCHSYSCDQFQRPFPNTFLLLTSVLLQSVTFGFLWYL